MRSIRTVRQMVAIISGWEFARRRQDVAGAALRLARTNSSDSDARLRLDQQTRVAPRAARRALKALSAGRDEFDHDRAYRLLEASLTHTPVQPVRPPLIELFLHEAALGRMPICAAFDALKKLAPELAELEVAIGRRDGGGSQVDVASIRHRIVALVGPAASEQHDSLARSQLALTIATQYLAIQGGDLRYGSVQTPYFVAPRKVYYRAGVM